MAAGLRYCGSCVHGKPGLRPSPGSFFSRPRLLAVSDSLIRRLGNSARHSRGGPKGVDGESERGGTMTSSERRTPDRRLLAAPPGDLSSWTRPLAVLDPLIHCLGNSARHYTLESTGPWTPCSRNCRSRSCCSSRFCSCHCCYRAIWSRSFSPISSALALATAAPAHLALAAAAPGVLL